ncbi:peptide chain release factor 4 [Rothia nasimurium]|uniref:peptide chain release factor 4 n=1 Tax=Rothia nasimurium TaxID=85336 RepID=UPI001F3702FA|nr:peptide chain release factor 4 [Rothia nasimurium]
MGLLKNLLLIAGGAAAGYLASRSRTSAPASTDLEVSANHPLQRFTAEGSTMAQFFDSKYGAPFKGAALKAIGFAATVKAGMDEKEAELKDRFDAQAKDARPGSLDTWQQGSEPQQLAGDQLIESVALPQAGSLEEREADIRRRLERDAELGKDFFA